MWLQAFAKADSYAVCQQKMLNSQFLKRLLGIYIAPLPPKNAALA